jgi:electron transfer flavoprotein alpha subunit
MIALVPVRDGALPAGAAETITECGGNVILAGSGTADVELEGLATTVFLVELGAVQARRWTTVLAPIVERLAARGTPTDIVVLPHSPDGRDLAPHLALALDRPLLAAATEVTEHRVLVARRGGMELHEQRPTGPFVATLQPSARGAVTFEGSITVERIEEQPIERQPIERQPIEVDARPTGDARVVEVLPPDVRTMDLSEARRIVGGGAGLESEARFEQLNTFAERIGGVMGATRVITDRSWVHHNRQIGTTGVVVDPVLYLSFGVSGAVQHTSGLGHPHHIISVNTDPHCPMMSMSDLAIVADANETLDELLALVEQPSTSEPANA